MRSVLVVSAVIASVVPVAIAKTAEAAPPCLIAVAGDIATSANNSEATAKLVEKAAPKAVIALGDLAYDSGTAAEFQNYYNPTWGRFKSITRPTPGNHEYETPGAAGYFQYFGNLPPYYAYDVCGWRALSLNSEISMDKQAAFVAAEAKRAAGRPMLAYWHRPRFSSSASHGSAPDVAPLWDAAVKAGVKLVFAGHDHGYERFAPTTRGTRQFVIGTGGASSYEFGAPVAGSQKRVTDVEGIGVFKLMPAGYAFAFRQTDGRLGDKGVVTFGAAQPVAAKPVAAKPTVMPVVGQTFNRSG